MHPSQTFPKPNPYQFSQNQQGQIDFSTYCTNLIDKSNVHQAEFINHRVENTTVNFVNQRDPRLLKKSIDFNNHPSNSGENELRHLKPFSSDIQNSNFITAGVSQQNCIGNSSNSNLSYFTQNSQTYQTQQQSYLPGWFLPSPSYQIGPEAFSTSFDKGISNQPAIKDPVHNVSFPTSYNNFCSSNVNFYPKENWTNFTNQPNKVPQNACYGTVVQTDKNVLNYKSTSNFPVCNEKIENKFQSLNQVNSQNPNHCNSVEYKTNNYGMQSFSESSNNPSALPPKISTDPLCNRNKGPSAKFKFGTGVTNSAKRIRRSRSRSQCNKYKSKSYDRSRSSSKSTRNRSRSPSKSKYRSTYSHRSRSRSKDSSRSRSRSRSRSISRSTSRYHSRSRSRNRSRSRSRNRSRSKSRNRSRSTSRNRSRSRSRNRSRSTSRNRSRSTSRNRSRSRSRSRKRSRSRGRNNSRSKFRYRSWSHSRAVFRSRSRSKSRGRRHYDFASSKFQAYDRRERGHDGVKSNRNTPEKPESLRKKLIEKWRMNNCDTQDEMQKRLQEISEMNPDEILEEEHKVWIRSAPADCYYERDPKNLKRMRATEKLEKLCDKFKTELLERGITARRTQNLKCPSPPKLKKKLCKHKSQVCSSSSESGDESEDSDVMNDIIEELQRKQKHPYRLHPELWYNDPGEMNDGPLCRCSAKARRSGIRHGFYAGENQRAYCDPKSNNFGSLYHYRITISPPTNFLTRTPTIINHDDHEFIFEGFSLISHYPIEKLPTCKVIRFNIEYIILYVEEKLPENFCIQEVDLFYNYLFKEILELVDFDLTNSEFPESCPQFHFMPRFVRELPESGRELLPMCEVLKYLLDNNKKLIDDELLTNIQKMSNSKWQHYADSVKGMVVTNPGMKPCSLRVDQLDRDTDEFQKKSNEDGIYKSKSSKRFFSERSSPEKDEKLSSENANLKANSKDASEVDSKTKAVNTENVYPEIVHFGIRPPQLSYAGNPEYQKAWREYVKFRHLLANMPKPTTEDKQKLAVKENNLHNMRAQNKMKRDVTVTVSSKGFYLTGLMCDVVQHAMLIPVLVCHLRFHRSLAVLEEKIEYKFKNRFLLQLALTHPSYRENFGTNPDHARNSLTNCGIRQPKYGDRRIHYMNTRKRGINTLISIMSRFGKKNETQSNIYHNERLEFLGDAVVEFITSIHLFHIFRDLEEGGLATYRAALVQNQHLAVLAKKLNLDEYMLYAHGSDLCHDLELKHAMANCFEALMGALFLDGGIEAADHVFGHTLYGDDEDCLDVWVNYPPHPLQEQEPLGDRKWIVQFPLLQKLTEFEEDTGIEFKHIRLLARAFTDRSVGYTKLTMGSNQRLEFLGDSVLQLIASEYLYKYFPEHHEGHLSLLRSSLVNNKTQSVVCDDLGMTKYAVYANPKVELKVKDRADLLEAFLGALYVDNGLEVCRVFCGVCFFPRLQIFIMNQDWNDPKSKLQQCCLTLRTMDNVEPDIPVYKVVECKGPTNTRVYTVAVYFRNKRLAQATGHSIQQAEMNAAQKAMEISGPLFPQLDHQKRVIAKSLKTQKWPNRNSWSFASGHVSPKDEGKRNFDED